MEIREDSRTALRREMAEELGCESEVGRLLWIVEDFFELSGRDYHEVALVHEFAPLDRTVLESVWTRNITGGGIAIEFRWFPLGDLEKVNLQPGFLRRALADPPAGVEHLIVRE